MPPGSTSRREPRRGWRADPIPIPPARFAAAPDCREAIAAWQAWLAAEKRASPHTIVGYAGDLAGFFAFLAEHQGAAADLSHLAALRAADFRAYLAHRASEGGARSSLARAMSVLRGFFRFLDRRGLVHNPALAAVRTPKLPVSVPKPLTVAAAGDVLDLAEAEAERPWLAKRDLAIFTLLYGCGLRLSEALGLARREAPLAAGMVRILGKGNKERLVPVLPAVAAAIADYLAHCPHRLPADGPLFVGVRGGPLHPRLVQRRMAELRRSLDLPQSATPHALRHSFAT
ncbi:MAG: tyrosine recombinase XerC, partial [Alphaproteobacteria bacterium]|nr:tyrosine recombinase XerC [Alphaproteobacteria bacterium]